MTSEFKPNLQHCGNCRWWRQHNNNHEERGEPTGECRRSEADGITALEHSGAWTDGDIPYIHTIRTHGCYDWERIRYRD